MKTAIEKAMKVAIENGYDECFVIENGDINYINYGFKTAHEKEIFLEPLFWQCLGKGLGWSDNPYNEDIGFDCHITHDSEYIYRWKNLIDHLADNKSIESFFEQIME